jgi:hypothetical protein
MKSHEWVICDMITTVLVVAVLTALLLLLSQ